MDNVLERLPSGSRVAVIRLRSLGDCVLTTPALALLRRHRPDLKITVIVEPRFAAIFEGNADVDEIRPGAARADLALNLHGGTRSMILTAACRAGVRAGFAHHRYSLLYSTKITTAQEILGVSRRVHTAEHLASAMFFLGVPPAEIPRAKLFAALAPDLPPYAVIHPFASAPEKAWPADRFTAVARHLRDRLGLEPVFLAGPDDDPAAFSQFRICRNEPLARVKSLLSGAQLFVGNDSGPAHIAAAFGVRVVALFGASDPVTWGPWRTEAHVLTGGMASIAVEDVVAAVEAHRVKA
jgi:lipopolysaccharide heptosyltransferase III